MVGGCGGVVEQWWFLLGRVVPSVGFSGPSGGFLCTGRAGLGSMGALFLVFNLGFRGPKWFMCLQISNPADTLNSGYRLRIHGTGSSGTR